MLLRKYGAKAEMLLIEIDSLMYIIETKNVYEDFYEDKELFDFSNYPKESKYYDNLSNFVVGNMIGETWGVPMKCFLWLKSKMYTFTTEENHEGKKWKGINKNVDDKLIYEEYKYVLSNRSYMRHELRKIQTEYHNRGIYRINEIIFSCYNWKNYTLKDGCCRSSYFVNSTR